MRLSSSKAHIKVKCHVLTYKLNDVTKRAPRDDNGNVMLMAQRA